MNITPDKFWELETRNQQAQLAITAQAISSALSNLAGMYGQYKDDKNQREAMNTTVMAMKDEKIISQDTLDKFLNTPARTAAIRVLQLLPAPTCILECGQIGRIPGAGLG